MSTDPMTEFTVRLAADVSARVLGGTWSKVKEWLARRRHADDPVVREFERDPAARTGELAALLQRLRFSEDAEGQRILAIGQVSGVAQIASGQTVIQAGRDVHIAAVPAGAPPAPRESLTAQQEALLGAIDDLQVQFGAAKLIVGRNGDVHLYGMKATPTSVNLVQRVLRDSAPRADSTCPAFEALVESLPARYLRVFPESGRIGNPFVVGVTPDGRTYLGR